MILGDDQPSGACSGQANGPRVFVFPGIGGAARLARFFAEGTVPVTQLSYPDWTQLASPGFTIDDLIARAIGQIEAQAPSGPLCLAGYSGGGLIAYSAALALQVSGRQVLCLAILDTTAFPCEVRRPASDTFWFRLKRLDGSFGEGLASVLARVFTRWPAGRLLHPLSRYRQLPFGRLLNRKITVQLLYKMLRKWRRTIGPPSKPLTTPAFLFRTQDHRTGQAADLGWGRFCANLEAVPVAGSHFTMLDAENNAGLHASFTEVVGRFRHPDAIPSQLKAAPASS